MSRTRDHAPSQRATVRQTAGRADYDRATVEQIVDAAIVATVSICMDGQPFAIPMAIARVGDHVYLHGSRSSRLMKHLAAGHEVCLCITHLDGIVVARSGMNCSANYRSVVIHGKGVAVGDADKPALLHQVVEAIIPGSAGDFREHLPKELKATTLVAISLAESACKVRSGGPKDDPDDLALPYWAGVIPVTQAYGAPVPATDLPPGTAIPAYALHYQRPGE